MLNRIVLQGRFVNDPEIKSTSSGTMITSFVLAVERNYKNNEGEREVDFINCVAMNGTAELIVKYIGKGRMVIVDGSLRARKYQDKENHTRTIFDVLVSSVFFCESKNPGTPSFSTNKDTQKENETPDEKTLFEDINDDDELPF